MSFQDEQNEPNIKTIGPLIKKLVFSPVLPPAPTLAGGKKGDSIAAEMGGIEESLRGVQISL